MPQRRVVPPSTAEHRHTHTRFVGPAREPRRTDGGKEGIGPGTQQQHQTYPIVSTEDIYHKMSNLKLQDMSGLKFIELGLAAANT